MRDGAFDSLVERHQQVERMRNVVGLLRRFSLMFSLLALWLVLRLGRHLLGADAGWWGGLLFAVLPLSVFYGRSIQPESLLLACSALALERGLAWRHSGRYRDLALATVGLTGAVLIKVLPAFWLGLPLLWLAWLRYGPAVWRRLELWLVAAVALGLTGAWYWHALQLFLQTGLSFGFWGSGANRYSWAELLGLSYWGNLLLRTSVRGLAVLGRPPEPLTSISQAPRPGQPKPSLLSTGPRPPQPPATPRFY